MEISNREIASKLLLISELLEITGDNIFKIRAFNRAADIVGRANSNVAVMSDDELILVPGIGQAIAKSVREIVETGTCKELEELRAKIPPSLVELLNLEGVGPKTIAVLWKKMNIQSIGDLEKAATGRRIRSLKGFGEKKEKGFLKSIALYRAAGGRMNRMEAELVVKKLEGSLTPATWTVAGSYRRGKSTIGDIDIVTTESPSVINPKLRNNVDEVIDEGDRRTSVRVMGQRVDIRFSHERQYGSMLIYLTGSKEFNIRLRETAIEMGRKVNEYGVEDRTDGKLHEFSTENDMFAFLGLQYIVPELRENRGEMELAKNFRLPLLIGPCDIRGDLHVHSEWSDGSLSLEQLACKGEILGYEYILCSDHSASLGITHGLDDKKLKQQTIAIERVNRAGGSCTLLQGIEVDILSNGSLGLENHVLSDLDLVIASVHSGLKEDRDTMTRRVISAVENENVDIIGHPTGRLIGKRSAFEIDMARVIERARDTGTALECNASPLRLDLDDTDIMNSKEKGVSISIGTDSHREEELANMRYGISIAQRGWCSAKDILNSLTLKEILNWAS
ncbi:MAG: DNA polymerase/3'-5' exonuclease PolX [Methanoregulaceae archaeon]|jgi:DNA polymerase (family 10)|nr:DNA polymerase/3'-5' exonuclease PolX [Methanoregulaceae archaeon]